ncbi:carnitine operon protein CaiE [Escherichia coli]|uniref:Carnitine operon protein CaiE n=1 Tax=Escherichia coli TaxID=562 RepID=A0A376W173_ECOLX|nr:carnitine operon protein CaiE [Escherichia coli]
MFTRRRFVHPSAVLIGDVIVGAGVYIGPLASLRGDYGRLIVQAGANIQDGCIMHGYCDTDTIVGENGHIGHGAILAWLCDWSRCTGRYEQRDYGWRGHWRREHCCAMSFVKAGFRGEKRQLLMGTPARAVRSVSDDELHWKRLNTKEYQDLVGRCHASLHETQPLRQMEENRPRLQGTTDVMPETVIFPDAA